MAEFLKKDFASIVDSLLEDLSSGMGGRVALTDTTEGSVVRTLVEAFSRELAVAYAQLDQVYQLGYVDTAHGAALDNVVALLGVVRRRGGYLQGTVTFTRAQPAPEEVPIPAGTPVAGKDTVPFETTASSSIPKGGTEATVAVRSTQALPPRPKAGTTPEDAEAQAKYAEKLEKMTAPGVLNTMPRPMLGVEGVTNRVRLVQQQEDETDDELRARARRAVSGANLGTRESMELALRELGLTRVTVDEPQSKPGVVEVVVGDVEFDSAMELRARRAIEETRPAGIQVMLRGVTWIWLRVEATVVLNQDYPEAERQAIARDIQQGLARYIEGLGASENVRAAKIRNILASNDKVSDVFPKPTSTQEDTLLRAYVETLPGKLEDQTARRRLRNGDVQVGAGERAGLDRDRRLHEPFALKLEPPAPRVFMDVELQVRQAVTEAEVRAALRAPLDDMAEQANRDPLKFDTLLTALQGRLGPTTVTSARFLLLHARDGRAVELVRAGDQDVLDPREVLELRQVLGAGGGA
ncbi:baseplate J/gp47 family protein [Hyalangium gracile]|uniref:baseplate J/gp47 family protein n=1 Tax=Hyalangium gracile TaxID=394092 RepID=UPI001CCF8FBA|nr:baseplate J/gp47 family protein [Hyalangium gracile]